MGLNDTPMAYRVHIGFFGRRNAGKSSVVNAVTGQQMSVVSDVKGTTTDPVYKSMELLPLGPVVIIDTPGFDDEGSLGELRIQKTREVLQRTDVAVLVADARAGLGACEKELVEMFRESGIPYLLVWNKIDLLEETPEDGENCISVSALYHTKIHELKEKIGSLAPQKEERMRLAADLVRPGDTAVLVTPIDSAAPKGRMILPQQLVIRDLIDADVCTVVVKENMLAEALQKLKEPPALVVTDSQVFGLAAKEVPQEVPLTSFSILMARYKGLLADAVRGAAAMKELRDGDRVLIAEGCTHHRQCGDIGTVKLPAWLKEYTGKELRYEFCSGMEFPQDLGKFRLILHCGGCMLNEREMRSRQRRAAEQGIPMTNYGVAIACMKGILKRSISMFPHLAEKL